MQNFVDETVIEVSSGNGGHGSVHFRREKYVPKGGPDGGDGGKGGDVVFVVQKEGKTLLDLKLKHSFRAENGAPGTGQRKHGKNGRDVEIHVPPGTVIRDYETGELIRDFTSGDERWVLFSGGRGGQGNWHFRSSRNQAPQYAQEGEPGKQAKLYVELRIIADIGFVGLPNAGKSTLLQTLSNAHPKIGDYPFTTKIPNLGILHVHYRDIVLADIPGLIEGASEGAGLGHQFLRHISRTKGLAYMIDCSRDDYDRQFAILENELSRYSRELTEKKHIIVCSKLDTEGSDDRFRHMQREHAEVPVVGISCFARTGMGELKQALFDLDQSEDPEK